METAPRKGSWRLIEGADSPPPPAGQCDSFPAFPGSEPVSLGRASHGGSEPGPWRSFRLDISRWTFHTYELTEISRQLRKGSLSSLVGRWEARGAGGSAEAARPVSDGPEGTRASTPGPSARQDVPSSGESGLYSPSPVMLLAGQINKQATGPAH